MKKGLNFVFVIIVIILLIQFASASWWSDFIGRITGKVVSGACVDSDGGYNKNISGTCTDSLGVRTEDCWASGTMQGVSEWFCQGGTNICIVDRSYPQSFCPNGCSNGACINPNVCNPSWSCDAWSACSNNVQTRTCTDSNYCGTITGKPITNQACVSSCTPNWQCSDWTVCTNNQQTRTCTDTNNCGTITGKPATNQACNSSALNPTCTPEWSCNWRECINGNQEQICVDLNDCELDYINQTEACLSKSCIDSDEKNHYAKGNIYGISSYGSSYFYSDYCDSEGRLREMYCLDNNIRNEIYNCSSEEKVCYDGVCINETEENEKAEEGNEPISQEQLPLDIFLTESGLSYGYHSIDGTNPYLPGFYFTLYSKEYRKGRGNYINLFTKVFPKKQEDGSISMFKNLRTRKCNGEMKEIDLGNGIKIQTYSEIEIPSLYYTGSYYVFGRWVEKKVVLDSSVLGEGYCVKQIIRVFPERNQTDWFDADSKKWFKNVSYTNYGELIETAQWIGSEQEISIPNELALSRCEDSDRGIDFNTAGAGRIEYLWKNSSFVIKDLCSGQKQIIIGNGKRITAYPGILEFSCGKFNYNQTFGDTSSLPQGYCAYEKIKVVLRGKQQTRDAAKWVVSNQTIVWK